jgi:HAD superfamily hydrolase (TIGR01509 family)
MGAPAACLFDLDGLLLDTEPIHGRAWREAALHFGLQLDEERLMGLRGRRRLENAREVCGWIAALGGPVPTEADLLAVQQPIARRLLPAAPAMEGARELLQQCLRRGVAMALVTSSGRDSLQLKTAGHPWLRWIQVRVDGEDPELGAGKPAPDPFLLAALRLGVEAGDCWAFEDSPAGARAAAAAGCRVHVLLAPGESAADWSHRCPGDWIFLERLGEVRF